ncbi:TPR repeat containing exported protein; Putative periplasmic protein contains a protein prenylyltransferase domain [hydrothermal vent metagenome]|uniref:TPR repeat containing exported protein Putative periplasmic protein contains a protein prenylyltransferase domain n=1 Tax=hydrothermal vent metagenome TaxID=652676 RepID=A0A3B1BS56_9ZZZZ
MQRTLLSSALLAVLSLGLATQSIAQEAATTANPAKSVKAPAMPAPPTTEERVERLERLVNSRGLVNILLRLENLQKDVQTIQGDNEVQMHKLDELRKRQRELYIDIDRRLLQLERKQTSQPAVMNTPPPLPAAKGEASKAAAASSSDKPAARLPAETIVGGKPTSGTRTAVAAKVVPKADHETEQQAYQKAFDLLRELRYDKAGLAFRNFIEKYPDGRYAHIAQYWLAEASYAQRDFKTAIADYQKLIDNYPGSPKRAEAMLKIGYSYYELKDYPKAQAMLEQLLASYPRTTEAGQAQNLLQKIKINNAS